MRTTRCRCGHDMPLDHQEVEELLRAPPHPCHGRAYTCRKPARLRLYHAHLAALAGVQAKFSVVSTWACAECWAGTSYKLGRIDAEGERARMMAAVLVAKWADLVATDPTAWSMRVSTAADAACLPALVGLALGGWAVTEAMTGWWLLSPPAESFAEAQPSARRAWDGGTDEDRSS